MPMSDPIFYLTFDRGVNAELGKGKRCRAPLVILLHAAKIPRVGSVAQLVEQGIHKPWVTGSSPVAAT